MFDPDIIQRIDQALANLPPEARAAVYSAGALAAANPGKADAVLAAMDSAASAFAAIAECQANRLAIAARTPMPALTADG